MHKRYQNCKINTLKNNRKWVIQIGFLLNNKRKAGNPIRRKGRTLQKLHRQGNSLVKHIHKLDNGLDKKDFKENLIITSKKGENHQLITKKRNIFFDMIVDYLLFRTLFKYFIFLNKFFSLILTLFMNNFILWIQLILDLMTYFLTLLFFSIDYFFLFSFIFSNTFSINSIF